MAWVLNGEVEAISGTIELEPGVAFPWLVGSDEVFGSARWPFARLSRAEAQRINAKWPRLVGYVHADNAAHVRWLQWCGFSLGQPVTHGVRGDLFHPFERLAHV
ncbi:MAG: hypothetical protein LCH78_18110 [Proteobacteria bacterium]|nr:hypothetical protein [Pseudomonadota bacterium]